MKQRSVTLDHIKGWAILVVVFVHVWRGLHGAGLLGGISEDVFWAVSSGSTILCMPPFFLVSGYLFGQSIEKRRGAQELASKFDRIFYPYLVWSLLVGLLEVFGSGYRNGETELGSLWSILWEPRSIFWFLYSLFNCYLVTEIVVAAAGVRVARLILVPIGVGLLLFWSPDRQLPFSLPQFQMSFIYFAIGFLIPRRWLQKSESVYSALVAVVAALAVVYVAGFEYHVYSLSIRSVSPNLTLVAVLVLLMLTLGMRALPVKRFDWLAELGRRSLDIYLLHLLVIAPIRIVLDKFLGIQSAVLITLLAFPLGVLLPLIFAQVLREKGFDFLFHPPDLLSAKRWMKKWLGSTAAR
ncbi:MAG: acyltransferase family protein [Aquabacterium sp.]